MKKLVRDDHSVEVAGSTVSVTGTTGPVHATWVLTVDGVEADRAKAAGDFRLHGELRDGSRVTAEVHQSLMGPTRVTVRHGDEEVATLRGFVA